MTSNWYFYSFLFKKFFFNKQGHRYLSIVAFFSIMGFVIGICSLIVVMSIMNGFQKDIQDNLKAISPDYVLVFSKRPSVKTINKFRSFLTKKQWFYLHVPLKGFLKNAFLGENILDLRVVPQSYFQKILHLNDSSVSKNTRVVLGTEAAKRLDLYQGKFFTLLIPGLFDDPMKIVPKRLKLTIDHTVKTGVYPIDEYSLFVSDRILPLTQIPSHWFHEIHLYGKVSNHVLYKLRTLPYLQSIQSWQEQNKLLYFALWLEQTTMNVFLFLIIIVALSSMFSLLHIFYSQKSQALGLLSCLGMTPRQIQRLLVSFGLIIGILGIFLGSFLAAGFLGFFHFTDAFVLPNIYYHRKIPIQINPVHISLILSVCLFLCLVTSILASRKLLKTSLLSLLCKRSVN